MRGCIEISHDMISQIRLSEADLVYEFISYQLGRRNHNIGWFAKTITPFGTTRYMWDENFLIKIHYQKKFTNFLLALKKDGWEIIYR